MKSHLYKISTLNYSSNRFCKFHIAVIKIKLYFIIFTTSTIKYKTFMRYVRVSKEEQNEALQMDALKN